MTRRIRLFCIALLALGLAPGTWLRTHVPPPDFSAPLRVTALADTSSITGDVELLGAWKLTSSNAHFGGYSALVNLGGGRLLAGSDRGRLLEMPLPDKADANTSVRFDFFGDTSGGPRIYVDLESMVFDAETRALWGAFEYGGRIQSFAYGPSQKRGAAKGRTIAAMQRWPDNGGPETMVRLADGRFIVLAETSSHDTRAGLMFAGDPLSSAPPRRFRFRPPSGYSPVDASLLPDGRVMILVRKVVWGLPPQFATGLVIADPAEIETLAPAKSAVGQENPWTGEMIAQIGGPDLEENFEGITAIEQADGSADLYLIADDNLSAFQETLMLRLNWRPAVEPASGEPET